MPQDRISRRDVEVEIREGKLQQIADGRKLELYIWRLDHDLHLLLAVDIFLLHLFEQFNRLRDPLLELLKRAFRIGYCMLRKAAEAGGEPLGAVAGALDLEGERCHVGC